MIDSLSSDKSVTTLRSTRVGVAVPAAGVGRRMGGEKKAWLALSGEPLLLHALRTFLDHDQVVALRVALRPEDAAEPPGWLSSLDERLSIVSGGATRAESVREALRALPTDLDVILVHDAARPLVTRDVVDRCIAGALAGYGAVAGWPVTDTLKEVGRENRIVSTPDRNRFWHAQTPQGFPAALLREAYEALDDLSAVTDDAAVVERAGGEVAMVLGSPRNVKVTTPEDVAWAEFLLNAREEG